MEVADLAVNRVEPVSDAESKVVRAEIDTSAPFESVKEAVTRFGGVGYWKPHQNNITTLMERKEQHTEELDSEKLEEQAAVLEQELILKERETLEVLKDLESTKRLVESLKSKLQKEESEVNFQLSQVCDNTSPVKEKEENKENHAYHVLQHSNESDTASDPGLILKELKQAKMNLSRTTNDIADVKTSVESLNKKLEKERISLEKTRERLTQNTSKITSLEEELNNTRRKLQVAKDAEIKGGLHHPSDITRELQQLSSEAERFKKIGEAAKSEVLRARSEIEQTKAMIRTAEIRLIAARKMKEAARAAEDAALAEIKALSCQGSSHDGGITLTFEEYTALTSKARDAEENSKRRVVDAMHQVDEANLSKLEIWRRAEEAKEEVETSERALEEALERVEAANRGKLAVEEALRKWRSEGHKRRSSLIHNNSTKFKNSSCVRRDSPLFDVNGMNLVNDDEAKPVLKPTLSIGQILSRKLMVPNEFEGRMVRRERSSVKRKVSLGQMLGKQNDDLASSYHRQVEKENVGQKQFSAKKRKKFGFGRFSLLLTKQQKKKTTLNLR